MKNYTYSSTHRLIEVLSIIAYTLTFVFIFASLFLNKSGTIIQVQPLGLLFSIIAAYLFADFLSGLVHFLCDNFGSSDTMWFGPNIIEPFREHHDSPEEILHHDFLELNGNLFTMGFLLLMVLSIVIKIHSNNIYLIAFLLFLSLFIILTNQIHKWSHDNNPCYFVSRLQKYHLILTPKAHLNHHTYPYNKNYCITNGWLNPVLTKIHFFENLKALVLSVKRMRYAK